MATCKDCVHYDICLDDGDDAAKQNAEHAEEECDFFKNKADVVEVVRCRDCKYVHFNTSSETYHCRRRGYYSEKVNEDDYCSYGKRKEDD